MVVKVSFFAMFHHTPCRKVMGKTCYCSSLLAAGFGSPEASDKFAVIGHEKAFFGGVPGLFQIPEGGWEGKAKGVGFV